MPVCRQTTRCEVRFAQARMRAYGLELQTLAAFAHFQDREEGFLRDIDAADPLHALLAFFLFFQELAFPADVAAVALRQNVLAHRVYGLSGDDLGADGGLDGDFKHLPGDQFAHFGNQGLTAFVGEVAVHDDGQGVHRLARHQNVELNHGESQ